MATKITQWFAGLGCLIGIHKWNYRWTALKFKCNDSEKRVTRTTRTRLCEECSKFQYRTTRPHCNGKNIDNKWVSLPYLNY